LHGDYARARAREAQFEENLNGKSKIEIGPQRWPKEEFVEARRGRRIAFKSRRIAQVGAQVGAQDWRAQDWRAQDWQTQDRWRTQDHRRTQERPEIYRAEIGPTQDGAPHRGSTRPHDAHGRAQTEPFIRTARP